MELDANSFLVGSIDLPLAVADRRRVLAVLAFLRSE
jgi:hypothetical protein